MKYPCMKVAVFLIICMYDAITAEIGLYVCDFSILYEWIPSMEKKIDLNMERYEVVNMLFSWLKIEV